MHITPQQKMTLGILVILIIGLIVTLLLASKSQDLRQRADSSLTCNLAPDQICASQVATGSLQGTGSCSPGNSCIKVPTLATMTNNTVAFASDVQTLNMTKLNLLPIITVVNGLNILGNPLAYYYDTNGKLAKGAQIAQVNIRLTDIAGLPIQQNYLQVNNGASKSTAEGYGNIYDPVSKTLTVFVYISDNQLQKLTTTDISLHTWRATLRALYEVIHSIPPTEQIDIDAMNTYMDNNTTTIPFTFTK